MIFVDSSAVVAIVLAEDDADILQSCVESAPNALTSPLVLMETVLALRRSLDLTFSDAEAITGEVVTALQLSIMPIDETVGAAARNAYGRFGKGTGHRAQLNIGDCFSYACAKVRGLPLLFKGDDFIHTDIADALRSARP